MKLQNTLRGLICEIASVDSVVNAIKNKQKVVISNFNPNGDKSMTSIIIIAKF